MSKSDIALIIIIIILFALIIDMYLKHSEYGLGLLYVIKILINNLFTITSNYSDDTELLIPVEHTINYKWLGKPQKDRNTHPFIGSCAIDYNNSGKEAVFIGGAEGQKDAFLVYENNRLKNIIDNTGLSSLDATYCALSFDLTNDGYSDMIIGRDKEITIYRNNKDGTFTALPVWKSIDESPIGLALSDIDNTSSIYLYVSMFTPSKKLKAFQFNNKEHLRTNRMFKINNLELEEITEQTNSKGHQNTFTSSFVNFGSGKPDLVLANDTGKPEILINSNGKFDNLNNNFPNGFWMGLAVGDFNNTGNLDLFMTNVGNTLPPSNPTSGQGGTRGVIKKGGLKEGELLTHDHIMLVNKGKYNFTIESANIGLKQHGFAWGGIMEDLTMDGNLDIIFGQNYVDLSMGKMLNGVVLKNNNGTYTKLNRYKNPHYAQTPLLADVDGDGIKEIIWINMHGPILCYRNNLIKGNYINVKLPNTIKFVNANVKVNGKLRQNIIGGIGFGSDQSHILTFGIGAKQNANIEIILLNGDIYKYKNIKANTTFTFK